jgi:hypothetical protein
MKSVQIEHTEDCKGKRVCIGKLVLIKTDEITDITGSSGGGGMRLSHKGEPMVDCGDFFIEPIIVSESEPFSIGDTVYDVEFERYFEFGDVPHSGKLKQVLVLPDQFPKGALLMIVNESFVNGESVHVECDERHDFVVSGGLIPAGEFGGKGLERHDTSWKVIKITSGKANILKITTVDKKEERSCPCLYLKEPCHPQCSCVHPFMSFGCSNCCTYGSIEQRKAKAEMINEYRLFYYDTATRIQKK